MLILTFHLEKSGIIECFCDGFRVSYCTYEMDACQWDTPKSWEEEFLRIKRTIKIKYDATTGDGDKIVVTLLDMVVFWEIQKQ